jgi:hypothetical protein
MNMEAIGSSEQLVTTYKTTQRHDPQDHNLYAHLHRRENLLSPIKLLGLLVFRKQNILILVRKPEGKRPLERSRNRWEDNIKMVLKEMRC